MYFLSIKAAFSQSFIKSNLKENHSCILHEYYTFKMPSAYFMTSSKLCLACKKELQGRIDKKFCDPYCKSTWHYEKTREGNQGFYARVNKQLKLNRRILKIYNKAGKSTVRASILIDQGFDPGFFTHYWKNKQGDVYLFVYEFGFLTKKEHGKRKYVLVTWQPYMEKGNN